MDQIGVIGATGMLGKPVVKELLKAGFAVKVLVRDTQKASKVLPAEVTLIQGDLKDITKIETFVNQVDTLYLNLSVKPESRQKHFQPEREGIQNIAKALEGNTSLKRIAYLSSLVQSYQGVNGFDWWVFAIKLQAVQIIKKLPIPSTVFYPSTFMENFTVGNYRQGNRIMLAGTSEYAMYFIAAEDYGRQVANALKLEDDQNYEFVIQGQEGFNADAAAKTFIENSPKKLTIIKLPFGFMKLFGSFTPRFNYGRYIIEALNNYPEEFEAEATWQKLGKPTISLQKFAQRH
ncbi:NmrA family transcriptional regulator [marine bacterium AO1-C]|nr:NmrA family transcriptional regulator [marine bacterium AO1-C]